MKFIYILVFKSDLKNLTGFFDRREMMLHEAEHLNNELTDLIWIQQP